MSIKNIIFDFGNVLFKIDSKAHVRFLEGLSGRSTVHSYSSGELLALIGQFEEGVIPESLFYAAWSKLENDRYSVTELKMAWLSVLVEPIFEQEEVIRKLKEKYKLVLLSNSNATHIREFEKPAFPILRHFKKKYYSHRIGYAKPTPHAYAFVLKENGFVPDETVFIDDRPENIEAAEKLGLKGIFLAVPEDLEKELIRSGLLE